MDMIAKTTIQHMIDALEKGQTPNVDPEEIPCFSKAALAENPVVTERHLEEILNRLTKADIPTLKRALVSLEHDDQAWLGFKVVTDPAACTSDDPGDEDTPISSDWGPSEDGQSCIFFANEGKDIVCSRPWNKRDRFQMLDITRGPSMHKDQFAGVTWVSTPLFATQRVVIYGAGDVSVAPAPRTTAGSTRSSSTMTRASCPRSASRQASASCFRRTGATCPRRSSSPQTTTASA